MFFKNKKINKSDSTLGLSKGFTLMELTVVMLVATVILVSLVVQNNKWNDHLTVSTQAYELALMIRQAQIWSLGVREDVGGSGDKFNVAYGVYFDEDNSFDRYTFFADRDRDNRYDAPSEAIETKHFTRGVLINRFCGTGGGQSCTTSGSLDNLTVLFFRPNTSANIYFRNNGGGNVNGISAPARVYLRSLGGKESLVTIDTNGQVSVDDL